jgi:ubiquinone/menaquinone biosynthesis C-methylase UbiE
MFWDKVAGVYDIFANIINKKTHKKLRTVVANEICESDNVLECACGTGLLTVAMAPRCKKLVATDFSSNMIKHAQKNCKNFPNVTFSQANIMSLDFPDSTFDVVVAANVIHLLDEPAKAIKELDRVCKPGGKIIIPTYMNKDNSGKTSGFAKTVGKAGADFKCQFTLETYKDFFKDLGYSNAEFVMCEGRIPCAVAVIHLRKDK